VPRNVSKQTDTKEIKVELIDTTQISSKETCLSPKLMLTSYDPFNNFDNIQSIHENEDFGVENLYEKDNELRNVINKSKNLNEISVLNLLESSNDAIQDNIVQMDDSGIETLTSEGIGESSQDFLVEMFGQIDSIKEDELRKQSTVSDEGHIQGVSANVEENKANIVEKFEKENFNDSSQVNCIINKTETKFNDKSEKETFEIYYSY